MIFGFGNGDFEGDVMMMIWQESKASVSSRCICYMVKKAESKWWNRLIKQEGKSPVFLKVDWDKWVDEDEEKGKRMIT